VEGTYLNVPSFLSESGCPGFEDLQDGYLDIVLILAELRIMMISGKEYLVNA